jgi:prevent-host-death family protein
MESKKDRTPLQLIGMGKARRDLSKLVKDVTTRKSRYLLSARGKPQAVVLGIDDYLRNILQDRRWSILKEIHQEALAKGLDKLSIKEIDQEVRAARRELSTRTS